MNMKAYFTVEAALVLPMVLGVYIYLIYGMFMQYDRCLTEQDAALLAMRGVVNWEESDEQVLEKLNRQAASIDRERFLAFQSETVRAAVGQGKVTVEAGGRLRVPFIRLESWLGEEAWTVRAEYTNRQLSPVFTIRTCRKLLKGKG